MFAKSAGIFALLVLFLTIQLSASVAIVSASVYQRDWFTTYVNELPFGNWTFVSKPVAPLQINASQIQIGANWTYIYTLAANRTYHVYCYGDWITEGSTPETDYDIYVYDPSGKLEGYHTEAAGLPEHLGNTVNEPFFTPKYSGNYSFVVRNDPRESQAADPATFMAIEHVEPNVWHKGFIEGKQGNVSVKNTSWAYEFTTSSERIEVQIHVPDTLDMYEARLYLMGDPSSKKGEMLNDVPLAWEPGLYGETSGLFGGYNFDSRGFRGTAYASCECFGQDMLINYSAPHTGENLYHLVLIGEFGSGDLSFRVKTDFGSSTLTLAAPVGSVYPGNETIVTAISANASIQQSFLYYSVDDWKTSTQMGMLVSDRACNGTIPGQEAGVRVNYRVEALDHVDNVMSINSSYLVKYAASVNLTLSSEALPLGENVSITGFVNPTVNSSNSTVKLLFAASNGSMFEEYCPLQPDGNFSASFKPRFLGSWTVYALFAGDELRHESLSNTLDFVVVEPSFMTQYSMYIYAAVGAVVVAAITLFMIRRRQ